MFKRGAFLLRNSATTGIHRGAYLHSRIFTQQTRNIGSCCAQGYFAETEHGDKAFSVRTVHLNYGQTLEEVGDNAVSLLRGKKGKCVLFTDKNLRETTHFGLVYESLKNQNFDVHVYDQVRIEPTDYSFIHAADWCRGVNPDICVSLGGGSVMDTAKAALLYAKYPPPDGDFLHVIRIAEPFNLFFFTPYLLFFSL